MAYYDHRHSGIDETNILQVVKAVEGETLTCHTVKKKPRRNAPNSGVENGGAEPKDVGVGTFRPPRRAQLSTSEFRTAFLFSAWSLITAHNSTSATNT